MTQSYNQTANLLIAEFKNLPSWQHKYRHLMKIGSKLHEFPSNQKLESNKVSGCESNVWLIKPTLSENIFISEEYGSEAQVGGSVDFKRTAISINSGSQVYDLNALVSDVSESGASIEVKRVHYEDA